MPRIPKRVQLAVLAACDKRPHPRGSAKAATRLRGAQAATTLPAAPVVYVGPFTGWTDPRGLTDEQLADKMDDEIDRWHTSPPSDAPAPLHDFLGLTWREYKAWMELTPLADILRARVGTATLPLDNV